MGGVSFFRARFKPTSRAEEPEPRDHESERPLVLLACRESSAHRWASRWFESSGFEAASTRSADDAVELLRSRRPAVVLTDMALRDGEGRRVCEAIRRLPDGADVPVLVMCSGDREIREALEAGATDLIRKPFNWQIAARRAAALVHLNETRGELSQAREALNRAHREVEQERQQIKRTIDFDPLTGLPNRAVFERSLECALGAGLSQRRRALVALFDLDRFVVVNSTLGRAGAASILKQVAQRLTACLRSEELQQSAAGTSTSMVARLDGDLFGVMLTGLRDHEDAAPIVRLFADRLAAGYFTGVEEIRVTTSIGVAVGPDDGRTAEDLLQKAELALCDAADGGGGAVRFYSESSHKRTERSAVLNRLVNTALGRGEFELHYQPLVDAETTRICAAEALLRWHSPELGRVPPNEFVPLAEESGLMVQIGTWVLRTACRQLKAWLNDEIPPIRMAVNVSLCQLIRGDLAKVVQEILAETEIPPALLELELSERGALRNDPDIMRQLLEIKQLGVRLAIDDFGTGNSAIAYLKQFPFDALKIDRSFVKGVSDSADDAAITSATIAMAHQLRLGIVAEGVEHDRQVAFLRERGCHEYQGFLFSPAVPADRFRDLVERGIDTGNTSES